MPVTASYWGLLKRPDKQEVSRPSSPGSAHVRTRWFGRVIGTVVSTVKISHLEGRTLLLVDQLDLGGKETGAYDIAVDTVQAGPGDTVLVMDEGNGVRQILGLEDRKSVV